jgi:hypothetical protein
MLSGTYYLNNNGSRWVNYTNGQKDKRTWETKSGKIITRTVIEYFSFGNFGGCIISYKGKKLRVLADTVLPD